jgi:hypothetical protein
MKEQNYKNHSQFVPGFHFLTAAAIFLLLIGSIVNLINSAHSNLYSASLIVLVALIFGLLFFYIRTFPLKTQDRVIRAEENLRHYVLAGKLLDNRLNIRQVIALRFAPDEEFVSLAKKAADENLSSRDIKKEIKNWRADHHRV